MGESYKWKTSVCADASRKVKDRLHNMCLSDACECELSRWVRATSRVGGSGSLNGSDASPLKSVDSMECP